MSKLREKCLFSTIKLKVTLCPLVAQKTIVQYYDATLNCGSVELLKSIMLSYLSFIKLHIEKTILRTNLNIYHNIMRRLAKTTKFNIVANIKASLCLWSSVQPADGSALINLAIQSEVDWAFNQLA